MKSSCRRGYEGAGDSLREGDVLPDFKEVKVRKRPIVTMKMIRYPPQDPNVPDQLGTGAQIDFGGVTVLLQEPERDGLEVWHDEREEWLPIPAVEDVYVVDVGDLLSRWSGREYKSARHRVLNQSGKERISCATFWNGNAYATNPLKPNDSDKEAVEQCMFKRFQKAILPF